MRAACVGIALFCLLSPNPVVAVGHKTGSDLYNECRANEADPVYFQRSSSCISYISGVLDSWMLDKVKIGNRHECIPVITGGEAKRIVIIYANKHPEDVRFPAVMLVRLAFSAAYPACLT